MTTATVLDLLAYAAAGLADRNPDLARLGVVSRFAETLLRAIEIADLELRLERLLNPAPPQEETA